MASGDGSFDPGRNERRPDDALRTSARKKWTGSGGEEKTDLAHAVASVEVLKNRMLASPSPASRQVVAGFNAALRALRREENSRLISVTLDYPAVDRTAMRRCVLQPCPTVAQAQETTT